MQDNEQTFVCIDEDEFERLKGNDFLLLTLQSFQNEKIKNINSEIDQEIKYKLQKIEKRQVEYERFVYDLNGDLRSLEVDNQRRMKAQNEKFKMLRAEYYKLLQEERNEYIDLFDEHDKKFTNLIKEEIGTRNESVLGLETKINSMLGDKIRKQERVNKFIKELIEMFQEVEKIPHNVFAKNQLEKLKNYIPEIVNDANSGFFETALNSARQLYKQLIELRDFVLQKEQEYLTVYYAALKKLRFFIEKIKGNKKVKVNIQDTNIEIDINYWTYECLEKLEKEINNIYANFSKNNFLTINEMENIIKNIDEKEKEFDSILNSAKENIILSQIRFNIAQKIVNELKKYIFFVQDSGYLNSDLRSDYFVELKNMISEKISITIKKCENKNINEVFINSNNKDYQAKILKELVW